MLKTKKAKIKLGIFEGKKAKYNEFILRALLNGPMKAWDIAKYIYDNKPDKKLSENWYNETQKINSLLTRRNGRLSELIDKEYIIRQNGKYHLTIKGGSVALTLTDSVKSVPSKLFETSQINFKSIPEFGIVTPFFRVDKELLITMAEVLTETLKKPDFYELVRKTTLRLMENGLNLDKISDENFQALLASLTIHKLMKNYFTKQKYAPNSDFRKTLIRATKVYSKKLHEASKKIKATRKHSAN
jgi:hypothetical protein